MGGDVGGELRENNIPEATKRKCFKEGVITELNVPTSQVRKWLKNGLAAWISLVTVKSVVLVE